MIHGSDLADAAGPIYRALIDAELIAVIGAGSWESSETRTAQHNGTRAGF